MFARVRAWLKDSIAFVLSKPAHLLMVGGFFLAGSIAGTPVGSSFYTYMWADHRFCDDCHVHDYANEGYEHSVHSGVTTCHDCHLVPIRHYPRNLVITLFDTPESQDDIHRPDVANVICSRCHSKETDDEEMTGPMNPELRKRIVKVDESPLHMAHLSATKRAPEEEQGGPRAGEEVPEREASHSLHGEAPSWDKGEIGCMDCHGSENNRAHHFEAIRADCIACHMHQDEGAHQMGGLECRECHFSGFVGKRPDEG